jgi:hypothetical protein
MALVSFIVHQRVQNLRRRHQIGNVQSKITKIYGVISIHLGHSTSFSVIRANRGAAHLCALELKRVKRIFFGRKHDLLNLAAYNSRMSIFTPAQSRAGRALLDWNQATLSEKANVALSTVRRFENGAHQPIANNLAAIRAALEAGGVIFLSDGESVGGGPGVRLVEIGLRTKKEK